MYTDLLFAIIGKGYVVVEGISLTCSSVWESVYSCDYSKEIFETAVQTVMAEHEDCRFYDNSSMIDSCYNVNK